MLKLGQMQQTIEDKEDKYLKLYQENVTIQEKLSEFQQNIRSGGALNISSNDRVSHLGSSFSFTLLAILSCRSNSFQSQLNSGGYDAWDKHYKDVIEKLQGEVQKKDLQNLQSQASLRKTNMEMEFVQSQFKEIKQLLKAKQNELGEFEALHKELINSKDLQIKELEQRIEEIERRMHFVKSDAEKAGLREAEKHDEVAELQQTITEKEQMIEEYREQIWQLKEDLMNKEQVIEALSNSLSQKGEEAADLALKLSVIKNQLIDAGTFDQRYLVTKKTKLGAVDRYVS